MVQPLSKLRSSHVPWGWTLIRPFHPKGRCALRFLSIQFGRSPVTLHQRPTPPRREIHLHPRGRTAIVCDTWKLECARLCWKLLCSRPPAFLHPRLRPPETPSLIIVMRHPAPIVSYTANFVTRGVPFLDSDRTISR